METVFEGGECTVGPGCTWIRITAKPCDATQRAGGKGGLEIGNLEFSREGTIFPRVIQFSNLFF